MTLAARLAIALVLPLLAMASRAEAEPPGDIVQWSARLAVGAGAGFGADRDPVGIFDLALRADALFGDPIADRARIGPALELRTATFGSIEVAGGVIGLVPLGTEFALTLSLGAGYAIRDRGTATTSRDGAIALGTLTASFRPYDHFDAYGYAVGIYVSGRGGFEGYATYEVTAGIEIDLELLVVAPVMFLVTATRGGDPHEPE